MNTPLSRPFLILCGLLYLGFGLAVLLAPEPALQTGFEPANSVLRDLHGSHGGLNTAAGLFLLYAAVSGPWHRPGVLLVALMNAGYLAGRLITLLVGGAVSASLLGVMALEAALCVLALSLAAPARTSAFYQP
ncbi:MAG: hypothetical protein AMJ59_20155 [Gammaproteobacteria bacterium SG8_31]|jgi:hypothetical protein|nr:MAG: hypothetical protein AMJ59_20155 [Gammaproteobacteria bacterium SG8_31]